MSIRDAIDEVVVLDLPTGPVLSGPTEVRWAEDIPGMGGKLHPMPVLESGVDPVKVSCGALFESAHPDAGPLDGTRLTNLLQEGKLCTHCLARLGTVNTLYLSLVSKVVMRAAQEATNVQVLKDQLTKDPASDKVNTLGLIVIARFPRTFQKTLDDARLVDGFDVCEARVVADVALVEALVPDVCDLLRHRPEFAEAIKAIDADRP